MWLSDLSIKRPVFITMIALALSFMGYLSFGRMPLDLFPDVSMPVIAVRTVYPGATPQEMETLVTKPIEEAVFSLNGVQGVRSTSTESVSLVVIEYDINYSSKQASDDVRQRVNSIRSSLPDDIQEPDVLRYDPSAAPVLSIALADREGKLGLDELRDLVDNKLVARLERLDGVGTIQVSGGLEREVHVDVDLERLKAYGLPIQQVISAVKGENLNLPGGRLVEGDRERLVRTTGEFGDLNQIGDVPITTPYGGSIHLRDVADVSMGFKETRAYERLDGRDCVVLRVQKQSGSNTVRVAQDVKAEMDLIRAEYPNLDVGIGTDQSIFTKESTDDVFQSLIAGGVLAVVIVFLFFRDLRNTLVTVAGLPIIVLGSFAAMHVAGFSINMITLLGLSLCIGMLIDDAIVVRENIFRHMEEGEEPREAASRGTAEIALAVLATTMTIVAVFGPIGFTPGIAGRFLREFGLTVAMAVLISLFEAFTLAPMLSAHFFKRRARPGEGATRPGLLARLYRPSLSWALRHRAIVVAIAIASLAFSGYLVPILGQSFIPDMDQAQLTVNLEMAPGTTLDEMDQVTRKVEQMLAEQPGTQHIFTEVGSPDGSAEKASIQVKLTRRGLLKSYQEVLRPKLESLAGVRYDIDVQANSLTGMASSTASTIRGRPINIAVRGSDLNDLERASHMIAEAMRSVPGAVDIDRSQRPGRPELQVIVDRARAADLGISTAQVGATVRSLINGETASKYRQADDELDILVRLQEEDRQSSQAILDLPLASPRGALVPLSSVAALQIGTGAAKVERADRQREIVVGAGYLGRELGEVAKDAEAAISGLPLPAGVQVKFTGSVRYMQEAFDNLLFALVLAIIFVFMVLASQFESLVHPFTIMLALPLSFVGAFVTLLLTGKSLDMMALIGIILLMGLVTKNSILLVDFANRLRAEGLTPVEAMERAGPIRLRPILMTTLAMIVGMLPVAMGYGAGAEARQPMALAVVGGLTTSTLLTLFVVPVAYTLMESLMARLGRRGHKAAPRAASA